MKSLLWNLAKYFLLMVVIVVLVLLMYLSYSQYKSHDPQGGNSAWCDSEKLPSVPNGSGMVVTAQNTVCSGFGGSSAIYVHLHKIAEVDSSETLVFRYSDKPEVEPPKIEWTTNSSVRITVGNVIEVSKQLSSMEGVNIIYDIGKADYPMLR